FHTGFEASQNDRFRAVVDKTQWQHIGAINLNEKSKRIDPDAAAQVFLARPEDISGADDHMRELISPAVLFDQFFLFEFSETVGIESFLRRVLQRTGFIQERAAFQT